MIIETNLLTVETCRVVNFGYFTLFLLSLTYSRVFFYVLPDF